jgi:predicted amino acid racemase
VALLDLVLRRNPRLVEAAFELHQAGKIPAATFLVDLDAVAHNARSMAQEAARHGLRVYVMSKQHGRNPYITRVCLEEGLHSTVAVEAIEAHVLHRYRLPIGHVGHLSNIPRHQVPALVAMQPEAMTVFTYEAAKAVSDAAAAQGREQALYVRVNRPGDETFKGMVGGWTLDECVEGIRPILALPSVRIAGLTQFPSISYTTEDAYAAQPTDGFRTMIEAKALLERELGLEDLRVNAPANNTTVTFGMLAEAGATDVEPGTGIMGGSLAHVTRDMPELPAQVYVSEIMHEWDGEVYALGGGATYLETYGGRLTEPHQCLVGTTLDEAHDNRLELIERGVIDYHLVCSSDARAEPGDTAVFGLHPQYYVNRCYVAVASGISAGEPRVEGLFDCSGNALDENFAPVAPADVVARLDEYVTRRAAVTAN